jgi:hypothetical protein
MSQGGVEKITALRRPEHRAFQTRGHANYHESGGGRMLQAQADIRDLMQPGETQTAAWYVAVDHVKAEGQYRAFGFRSALPLQLRDRLA